MHDLDEDLKKLVEINELSDKYNANKSSSNYNNLKNKIAEMLESNVVDDRNNSEHTITYKENSTPNFMYTNKIDIYKNKSMNTLEDSIKLFKYAFDLCNDKDNNKHGAEINQIIHKIRPPFIKNPQDEILKLYSKLHDDLSRLYDEIKEYERLKNKRIEHGIDSLEIDNKIEQCHKRQENIYVELHKLRINMSRDMLALFEKNGI